jgi:hypothetical protein
VDEQFEALTIYWVQAFAHIVKLLGRCDITLPKVDPAIPGLTFPAIIRAVRQLDDPRIPASARHAVATVVIRWFIAKDVIDAFDDDPQPWRFTAVLDLITEVHELAEAAEKELDRRDQAN